MKQQIAQIQASISQTRQTLTEHPVYQQIHQLEHLQIFMQHHVFAVWDFMSLLKVLQRNLTCVEIPWIPVGNADTRYLINEIVNGEESDVDQDGNRLSHFEIYLNAMRQAGTDCSQMENFLTLLNKKVSVSEALIQTNASDSVKQFVDFTFEIINSGKPHIQAAVFTFGREDLIPDMFVSMVKDLNREIPEKISVFNYYLERHIEVDGDHHSHLAIQMVEDLCGEDAQKWEEAAAFSQKALEVRQKLWDGIAEKIKDLATIEA
ncbi:Protein of unknown function [Pseudarcicella hirudinis]|uniref:DUF3050 domain-containing protein n=1 Tax=Pseudarcicella hirudinis TaxID=1079859 RepID=A0A1I5UW99_9BACT|nr:DUF3050 domain-containing protein [Pseudarcicella hirudinis]SFP99482.1 Protein of unknown function [Pseudarcicella hirudinis]